MSLAFFARGKLMKVAVAGGVPVYICDAPDGKGGAWSPTGTILFGPDMIFEGLARVSASGGPVQPATLVDFDRDENSHRWPVFLPDGIHFLYYVRASINERRGVYVGRIDQPASKPGSPLFRSESEAIFVATSGRERGVLLSTADGQLQARPFDATTLSLVGDPRTLPVAAGANTPYHSAMLSGSADLLATVPMPMAHGVRLATVARDGTAVRMSERQPQGWPRLSPDGKRMVRQLVDPVRGNPDIWVEDLYDGSLVRVTTATGSDLLPVWSPDGLRLAYGSGTLKERRLSIAAADGTGVAQELPCPGAYCEPTDWSPDGRSLIVNTRLTTTGAGDVWSVSLEPGGAAKAILSGPFPEYDARISPDGQWLAYVSEEAGRPVVSVRAMSGQPKRLVVSSDGGSQPVWRRDGQELLFVDREGRLRGRSVRRQPTGELTLGVANALNVPLVGSGHWGTQYRRVARRATRVLHRPDAGAEAERHPGRDWVARAPQVRRADPSVVPDCRGRTRLRGLERAAGPWSSAPRLSHLIHGVSSTLPPLAVSICVDFTVALTGRVNVTVYCDNKLLAMLLSIASRPVGSTIVRRVPPLDRVTTFSTLLTIAGRGRGAAHRHRPHGRARFVDHLRRLLHRRHRARVARVEVDHDYRPARARLVAELPGALDHRLDQYAIGLPVGEQPLNVAVERRRLAREVDRGDRRSGVLQDRNLRVRIAALDGRNKRREPPAIVLGRVIGMPRGGRTPEGGRIVSMRRAMKIGSVAGRTSSTSRVAPSSRTTRSRGPRFATGPRASAMTVTSAVFCTTSCRAAAARPVITGTATRVVQSRRNRMQLLWPTGTDRV